MPETWLASIRCSFYWHFTNRQALVEAALARWEQQTEETIAAVLRRVTERRMHFIETVLRSIGFPALVARRRSQLAYTIYLGQQQLAHTVPGNVLEDAGYLDTVIGAIIGPD